MEAASAGKASDQFRLTKLARILLDLHRCEHGRPEGGPCLSCSGPPVGSTFIPPGATTGHARHGDPIVAPPVEGHNGPESWVRRP